MRTHNLLSLTAVAGLALLLCGCATMSQSQSAGRALHKAKVAALVSVLALRYQQDLDDGHAYSLTELQGLDAAFKLGPEGHDAATLWEQEIERHYQNSRLTILEWLRREVSHLDEKLLDTYLEELLPASNREKSDKSGENSNTSSVLFRMKSRARVDAQCRSLKSTPIQWTTLYPDRRPFSFERFGINHALLKRGCTRSARAPVR